MSVNPPLCALAAARRKGPRSRERRRGANAQLDPLGREARRY